MNLAALVIYLLCLLLAFGLRSYLAWRRAGDTGFRRPEARAGKPDWWATLTFVVASLLGLVAPVAALLDVVAPAPGRPGAVLGSAGLVAMALGLVLILVAQAGMGGSWRVGVDPGERTELVTTGLFARVRNPIFTGLTLVLLGLLAAVPTLLSAAALAAVVVAVQLQTRFVEEPYLRATHPTYLAYAARSGRFVPGIGRVRPTDVPPYAG